MHPLPAAQATAASLHSLLPLHEPKSSDEQLVIDAIIALRRWATPDQPPVPTRLRLRPSLPLRIRVRTPSSEATPIEKHGKRLNLRSRRGSRSTNSQLSFSQGARPRRARKPSSTKRSVDKGASQPRPSSSLGSQVANFSDLSTEPPEGWPKLTGLSSPVLELGSALLESEKDLDEDRNDPGAPLLAKRRKQSDGDQCSILDKDNAALRSKVGSPHGITKAISPSRRVFKRCRISPETLRNDSDAGKVNLDSGPTSDSPGSTRGADSPADSASIKESGEDGEVHAQQTGAPKQHAKKRKNSIPKRRRPTSPGQNSGPSFITENENKKPGDRDAVGLVESAPPSFDAESPRQKRFDKSAHTNGNTKSPAVSATQKSKEQDTDSHSDKSNCPTDSLGSVVAGSASYDGRSVDTGYNRTRAKQEDIPSRPSSVVCNESNVESIEEPMTGDESGPLFESIEETEKLPHSELQQSVDKSRHSDSSQDHGASNLAPQDVKNERPTVKSNSSHELITLATLPNDADKLLLSESKNSSTTPSLPHPGKYEYPPTLQVSTPLVSGRVIPDLDKTNTNHQLPNHTSPVSPDDPLCKKQTDGTQQQVKSNCPSEVSISEMVICIANFTNEIESELANEIVMRLGGEIVSDFGNANPECVVASVDPQTKEVVEREMVIHFALASGVPIVGLPWLTQCFKSGCWVDFKNFETLSSQLRPNPGVFTGVAATFEDAFSRKNAKEQCREYRDGVHKLIVLAGGVIIQKSKIVEAAQNDKTIRLHIQIAYDFNKDCLNTELQENPGEHIPMRLVNKSWISACLFSGKCPPP